MNGFINKDSFCQVGILVNDIETTGKMYADFFGIETPPVIFSGDPERVQAKYNGEENAATCKMMFFQIGNMQLELIQPDEKSSVWHDDLEKRGEGLHHIAFQVKESKQKAKELDAAGFSVRMVGDYGDNSGCFHYVDAQEQLKMTIELLESYER